MHTVASEETYSDGQLIFREGSPGDWVYIILSGSVEITKSVEGREVVIEVLKEGEVFGELGFLGGIRRTAGARAEGETTLGVIDRTFLDHEFNKLSTDFRSILVAVVKRFKKMIDQISETSYRMDPRLPNTLSLAYKDRQSFVKAYTVNVSLGGLFIKTEKPLAKGEKFQLKLQLPDIPDSLMIQCQVAWTRKPGGQGEAGPAGMGITFMQMSPKDDQVFKRYLRELMINKE
ncbi:MAG: TIGR02266 family protein [Deltaproteobacteria bacterium]|nr:TIGR02266 family protein [Deltaproteobacteria bacterium]